jgi:hypothetical protein
MGSYHIRYQIKIPVPDLANSSAEVRFGMESLIDDFDLNIDSTTDRWIKRQRIKIIAVSILAGMVMLYVMRRAPLDGESMPLYAALILSIAQGLVYWLAFSWILDTFYFKPRLVRMLPKDVQDKGLIKIIKFRRTAK